MREMTIEQAVEAILGPAVATRITMTMGLHWAVVAAMAQATTADDPRAMAAIRKHNDQERRAMIAAGCEPQ